MSLAHEFKSPYPGIAPFTYLHGVSKLFFEREDEVDTIIDHIIAYRSVLLFSESGIGKSSLVNAGILPNLIKRGFSPEKIRLHPNSEQEFEIERISTQEEGRPPFLKSLIFEKTITKTLNFSIKAMDEKIRSISSYQGLTGDQSKASSMSLRPLLIFDQFEEVSTRFDVQDSIRRANLIQVQKKLFDIIQSWHEDKSLSLKILFVFREEYLAKLNVLFRECQGLNDRQIRLRSLRNSQLKQIVRGPFLSHKGQFQPELDDSLASSIQSQFRAKYGDELPRPTELQIVCECLFEQRETSDLHKFFDDHEGVNGIVKNYYVKVVETLPGENYQVAIQILTRLLTSDGTRDLIDATTLVTRIKTETRYQEPTILDTLKALEGKLIRREPRGNRFSYEIISEYLVPWIKEAREEQRLKEEQSKALAAEAALGKEEELRHDAESQKSEAEKQRAEAEKLKLEADKQKRRAITGITIGSFLSLLVVILIFAYLSIQENRKLENLSRFALETSLFFTRAKASMVYTFIEDPEAKIEDLQSVENFALGLETNADETGLKIKESDIIPKEQTRNDLEKSIVQSIKSSKLNETQIQRVLAVARAAIATNEYRTKYQNAKSTIRQPAVILSLAYHQSKNRIITGDNLGVLKVWKTENDRLVVDKELKQEGVKEPAAILSVAFSEEGTLVVAGTENGGVYGYRYDNDSYNLVVIPDGIAIDGVVFKHYSKNKDAIGLLIARRAPPPNHLKKVDDILNTPAVKLSGEKMINSKEALEYNENHRMSLLGTGTLISDSASGGSVTIYNVENNEALPITLKGHESLVYRVASDKKGSRFATAGKDGTARVWDQNGKEQFRIHTMGDAVHNVALSPDGSFLSTISGNGIVETWSIGSNLRLIYPMEPSKNPGYAVYIGTKGNDGTSPLILTSGTDIFFNHVPVDSDSVKNNKNNKKVSVYDCPGCTINGR